MSEKRFYAYNITTKCWEHIGNKISYSELTAISPMIVEVFPDRRVEIHKNRFSPLKGMFRNTEEFDLIYDKLLKEKYENV